MAEIESALRKHPGLVEALVTARLDTAGENRLVGYLVAKSSPPAVGSLREFLRAKLPAYMVPTHFVMLKEFPVTPNGKIDVRRLPAPEEMAAAPRTYAPPRNDREQVLAEIWQEVLKLRQIGIDDDFFSWAPTLFRPLARLRASIAGLTPAFRFARSLKDPPWPLWPPRWTMPRSAPPPADQGPPSVACCQICG